MDETMKFILISLLTANKSELVIPRIVEYLVTKSLTHPGSTDEEIIDVIISKLKE